MQKSVAKSAAAPSRYELALEAVSPPGICLMRCILALSGLFILVLHLPQPGRMADWTSAVLFCYAVYGVALYYHATRRGERVDSKITHWLDVAWYLALIGLSGGTKSLYFPFFFFAILVSSFRFGFLEGMKVTLASAVLSSAIGFAVMADAEHWRGLLPPIYLLVLGYLIARWGDSEILLKKRLALLRELNRLPNPRFGIDNAVGAILRRLRAFYNADVCLAITRAGESYRMYLADEDESRPVLTSQVVPEEMSRVLLALPSQCAAVFNARPRRWRLARVARWQVHCTDAEHPEPDSEVGQEVANILDTQSLVSVPMQRPSGEGRLYVTSRSRTFDASDMHFIRQLAAQFAPVIENMQLLDRIASEAAGVERQKISRDLHDSTIQPYVGLKIGLEALRRKVSSADPIAREIDDLCDMTHHGIGELRRYVADLKTPEPHTAFLFREVWKQAERFETFHGIEVEVNVSRDDVINDRLAAEIVQIVSEGLSNIKRHTNSRRVTLNLRRHEDRYIAQIINHGKQHGVQPFVPRSLTERAGHLGGKVEVKQWEDGTAVTVEIPL